MGWHPLTLRLMDMAGNETVLNGSIEVTWRNLVYLELAGNRNPANQAPSNAIGTVAYSAPLTPSAPPAELSFGGEPNAAPQEAPSATVVEGTAQPFAGASAQAGGAAFNAGGQSSDLPIPNSNILWGGAAAALLGATLAEWQRRREEAARRNGGGDEDEIPADVLARKRAKVIAKNEAKRAQERLWEAARQQAAKTDAETAAMREKQDSSRQRQLTLTKPFQRPVQPDGIPDGYVEIPPLTPKQHVQMKNWNVAAQVATIGVTAGITAAAGFAIGLRVGGPSGGLVGTVIGAMTGVMWGAYEVICLSGVQEEFDQAYDRKGSVRVWREGRWSFGVHGGGETYTLANGPLSATYVAATTFLLTGQIP